MKKILVILLIMALVLCGCGKEKEAPAEAPAANAPAQVNSIDDLLEDADPVEKVQEEDYASLTNALLEEFENRPFSEFVEKYGEPLKSEITDSCLGNGGEGNYYYEHYTVYTIINDGKEYIADVR